MRSENPPDGILCLLLVSRIVYLSAKFAFHPADYPPFSRFDHQILWFEFIQKILIVQFVQLHQHIKGTCPSNFTRTDDVPLHHFPQIVCGCIPRTIIELLVILVG